MRASRKLWILAASLVVLGLAAVQAAGPDKGKGKIEIPTKELLAAIAAAKAEREANPKVEPGKVRWHASFAEACAASRTSGKPVLLFQLLGKLDDQFC